MGAYYILRDSSLRNREKKKKKQRGQILLLHRTWVLPRAGIKLLSPASAGGFFTTEPPGKPLLSLCSKAREPRLLSPGALEPAVSNKRNHCNEKPIHCNSESSPHSPQLHTKEACTPMKMHNGQK